MFRKIFTAACLTVGLGAFAPSASAALIATIEGNDCSGVFGQGFANCRVLPQYDPNETPIIIKFNLNQDGTFSTEINSALFPSIDGSEFSFDFGPDGNSGDGIWTYNPGPGDPVITFFVAKGGPNFNLFSADNPLTDDWFTPTNPNNGQLFGLSHLSFYDTNGRVPEPMPLALLGAGLIGLFLIRRRRTS